MNARQLPEEGLDLRQELLDCQNHWLEQALHRTKGDRSAAAKLLGTNVLTLDWLQRVLAPSPDFPVRDEMEVRRRRARLAKQKLEQDLARPESPTPASEAPTLRDLPKHTKRAKVDPEELGRIDNGLHKVSRAVIRRLAGEGLSPKEIGRQLGVHFNFVEKVLRSEVIRDTGPKREPPEGNST